MPPRRRASRAPPRRARRRLVRRAGGGQGPVGRAPPRRAHVLSRRPPHLLESSAGATRPARAHNFVSQLQFLSLQALRRFLYLFLFKSHCARSPIVKAQVKGLVSNCQLTTQQALGPLDLEAVCTPQSPHGLALTTLKALRGGSRPGCGRVSPLASRVTRVGLETRRPQQCAPVPHEPRATSHVRCRCPECPR